MSAKSRKIYIVMGYDMKNKYTYISEICSSKKRAEEYKNYIDDLMKKHEPDTLRVYWVYEGRVC